MREAHGSEMPLYDKEPWDWRVLCWAHNVDGFSGGMLGKKWVEKAETGQPSIVISPVDRSQCAIVGIPVLLSYGSFSPPDLMDASVRMSYRGREPFELYVSDASDSLSRRIAVGWATSESNVALVPMGDLFESPPAGGLKTVFLGFSIMDGDFVLDELSLRWD
jgi:hypothetical protein